MKKTVLFSIFACLLSIAFIHPSLTLADEPKAREIMRKVEDRDDGDNMTSDMEMILIDTNKKKRIRKISSFSKDKGKDSQRLIFFIHPPEVKNTGLLTYDYDAPDRDNDQWLYLPELKKTKRIASSDKNSSFMGSDLNYSDMTSKDLEDYDFSMVKEDVVNGHKVWLIQSVPRSKDVIEETGYKKSILFIRQDNYFVLRAVNWVDEGNYLKYMEAVDVKQIDGIWMAGEIHMTKKRGKKTVHKTILKFHNIKFNQNLDDDLFTIRTLEKGL